MTRVVLMAFLVCSCCLASAVSCSAQTPLGPSSQSGHSTLLDWAREQAVVLNTIEAGSDESDLTAFKQLVGNARIVLLGDSRHDAREQWILKHRLIEFLVKSMGFSVLAMEESLPCTSTLNACLLGEQDDLDKALREMGSWYIWDTVELQALMSSLRAHNEKATAAPPQVRVYGFDCSDGARRGVEYSLAFLAKADPDSADRLRSAIDLAPFSVDFWPQTMQKYGALTPEAVDSLGAGLTSLIEGLVERRDLLVAQNGEAEYEWALRHAIIARQAHDMMISIIHGSFEKAGATREVAMAANLSWLLRVAAPGEKIIVWAHNFHVARATQHLEIPGRPPATMDPLGHLLAKEFGDSMISIGFSFERGVDASELKVAPKGWVDNVMAEVGPDAFLLDLRTAPPGSAACEWLEASQAMRGEGGMATLVPVKAFDAIAFVRRVGQVTRTAQAGARRAALNKQ